jgi:hypothetical protein
MISPHKLSATRAIADFRLPIADLKNLETPGFLQSGNWQSEIGNNPGR